MFLFSISRYSTKFDSTPIFSDRLYCTSEEKALFKVKEILISVTVPSEASKHKTQYSKIQYRSLILWGTVNINCDFAKVNQGTEETERLVNEGCY